MEKLVFVTHNKHKISEINDILGSSFEVESLDDVGYTDEIPETGVTLKENAQQKTDALLRRMNVNCFSDDTGLEIDALGGQPGVYSARYAGEGCTFDDNVTKVLQELEGVRDRKARFKTVISLYWKGKQYFFTGVVEGRIAESRSGMGGFGYDPVFIPDGYSLSFAEMSADEKHAISHRGKAVAALAEFLKSEE